MTNILFTDTETAKINEQLPLFIRQNSTVLVQFLEEYYRFLNTPGDGPSYILSRIIDEHDIDKIVDEKFLDRLKAEIALGIPNSPYVIKSFLLKRIVEYYELKGSDESIRYFFRIFYNDDIDIYYPWDRVLIPSEGNWNREIKLRVVGNNIESFEGKTVYQPKTKAQAFVKSVVYKDYSDERVYDLNLIETTIRKKFEFGYPVTTLEDDTLSGEAYRSLIDIEIINGGQNYQVNDTIQLLGIEKDTFKAAVDLVGKDGEVKRIRIVDFGSGNTVNFLTKRLIDFQHGGDVEYNTVPVEYIDDSVVSFTDRNEVFVNTVSGTGLSIRLKFGTLVKTFGFYKNDKSHLSSSSSILQDSYYHQKFSYEITSEVPYAIWKTLYQNLVHSSGMLLFNNKKTIVEYDLPIATNQISIRVPLLPRQDTEENLELENELDVYTQSYFANALSTDPNTYESYTQIFQQPYVVNINTRNYIVDSTNTNSTTQTFSEEATQGFT